MSDTQQLVDQARALGEAIAQHPHVAAFLAARDRVQADSEAQKLLGEYQQCAEKVRRLEAEQKPVEPEDKRKLKECEQQMASNETLKQLMRTQMDYVGLMNQINQAMEQPLSGGGAADRTDPGDSPAS